MNSFSFLFFVLEKYFVITDGLGIEKETAVPIQCISRKYEYLNILTEADSTSSQTNDAAFPNSTSSNDTFINGTDKGVINEIDDYFNTLSGSETELGHPSTIVRPHTRARFVDISNSSCCCPNCGDKLKQFFLSEDEKSSVRFYSISICFFQFFFSVVNYQHCCCYFTIS